MTPTGDSRGQADDGGPTDQNPESVRKSSASETTPLLSSSVDTSTSLGKTSGQDEEPPIGRPSKRSFPQPIHLILLTGFLISTTFAITQVPIVYVFRVMSCEAYYSDHDTAHKILGKHQAYDRCAIPDIEAATASALALIGMTTTIFGLVNLLFTRQCISRLGLRSALALQTFTPAIRLLIQTCGVTVGGRTGIIVMQSSQVVTIAGGPNGYMLALNAYVAAVLPSEARTAGLGQLQGCMMLGSAAGYLIGGLVAGVWGIKAPFELALLCFLSCTTFVVVCLPYVQPAKVSEQDEEAQEKEARTSRWRRMLGPLKSVLPSQWVRADGRVVWEYGPVFLAAGAFMAVLATGYLPTLLQMYATDIFGFGPAKNSYLVASHSFLRGLFLMFVFPRIIALGRSLLAKWEQRRFDALPPENIDVEPSVAREGVSRKPTSTDAATDAIRSPTSPRAQLLAAIALHDDEQEDLLASVPGPVDNTSSPTKSGDAGTSAKPQQSPFQFDLYYTRLSIIIDGALTACAAAVSQGWQMYLLAAILPLGAGTASAAKGVILQMCAPAPPSSSSSPSQAASEATGAHTADDRQEDLKAQVEAAEAAARTDALSALALVEMTARLSTTFVFGLAFAAFAKVGRTELVFVCNAAVALAGGLVLGMVRFPPVGARRITE
jgi:hypothetical protein